MVTPAHGSAAAGTVAPSTLPQPPAPTRPPPLVAVAVVAVDPVDPPDPVDPVTPVVLELVTPEDVVFEDVPDPVEVAAVALPVVPLVPLVPPVPERFGPDKSALSEEQEASVAHAAPATVNQN